MTVMDLAKQLPDRYPTSVGVQIREKKQAPSKTRSCKKRLRTCEPHESWLIESSAYFDLEIRSWKAGP